MFHNQTQGIFKGNLDVNQLLHFSQVTKFPAGTNMYLQGLGNIFFATNTQHSHCMVNTLHKIMNNQATDGDMSKATTKIKPILIKLNFAQLIRCNENTTFS